MHVRWQYGRWARWRATTFDPPRPPVDVYAYCLEAGHRPKVRCGLSAHWKILGVASTSSVSFAASTNSGFGDVKLPGVGAAFAHGRAGVMPTIDSSTEENGACWYTWELARSNWSSSLRPVAAMHANQLAS